MIKFISSIIFLTIGINSNGQTLDSLVQNVTERNARLIALQKWIEAEKVRARTGIYPENPEISYIYLFSNSAAISDQKEFEVMQPFRLPGYYTSKSDIQQLQYEQKKLLAKMEQLNVLHTVRSIYFNLVFLTKKRSLLRTRNTEAERLVTLMHEGFVQGELSKSVYDRARIYKINIQNDWQKTISDIEIQKEQLKQLNGGTSVNNLVLEYPVNWILPTLDSLLTNLSGRSPDLQMVHLGIDEYEKLIKFEKMNSLPSFEAGYKSETILNQKLKGVHLGITIPLWQNNNRVKHVKIQSEWSRAYYDQKKSEIRTEVISLYNEAQSLYTNYIQMKEIIDEEEISESSLELLHSGQISFPEYLIEVEFLLGANYTFLETEKAFFSTLNELKLITCF